MSVGLLERSVAKKKAGDTSIRLRVETADVIRDAARLRRMSIGQYIDEVLLPVARRDVQAEMKKRLKGDKPD